MKYSKASRAIPLKTLVRAYELWITTDMSMQEVARALEIPHNTLTQSIVRAERKGLYGDYIPICATKIVIEFLARSEDYLTVAEITDVTGITAKSARSGLSNGYVRKYLNRRRRPKTNCYEYAHRKN